MKMNTTIKMLTRQQLLAKRGLEQRGVVQRYVDSEVLRRSTPYLPLQTGALRNAGIMGTDIGSGQVCWNGPYAKYLYHGKVMVGEHSRSPWANRGERKVVTDKAITYHGAPKRGPEWFEQMKIAHRKAILSGAAKLAGGKYK